MSNILTQGIQQAGTILHIPSLQNYGTASATAGVDSSATKTAAPTSSTPATDYTTLIIGAVVAGAVAVYYFFIRKPGTSGRTVKFKKR